MTIEQYWNSLLSQWKLIIISFVIVGLGAYIGSRLLTPMYQSTVLIQVTIRSDNRQADINSLLASDQLVQTESLLAVSDPVLHEVASHYPNLMVDQLIKNVSVVAKPNTQLFEIDVLDAQPTKAALLANDIAKTLIKQQAGLVQQDNGRLQQQLQQDLQQTQKQIDAVTGQISALKDKEKNLLTDALGVKLNNLQEHYRELQSQLTSLELTQAQGGEFLHIAQPARPALSPARPNVLLNTGIGLLAGLLTGLLLAMLLEQLDTRIRTEDALSKLVNWPILTTLWRQNYSKKDKKQSTELVDQSQHSANIESYRILRTNIGFSMIHKAIRSIAVISASPHEGKSFVAANLAIFMAKAGKKTLLIDVDLRRPTINKKFQLPSDKMGFTNAIMDCYQHHINTSSFHAGKSGQQSQDSFSLRPYIHAVDIPNLLVMPSGPLPPNPPELLDSKAMEYLLVALANSDVDMIIFDTPPLLGLSDANILVPKVDGVLAVIDITSANRKKLQRLQTQLAQTGSHILGCVVNKQVPNLRETPYAYYYYSAEEETQSEKKTNGHVPAELQVQATLTSPSHKQTKRTGQ